MKKIDIFLVSLVPVQLWGFTSFFLFTGNPTSWTALVTTLLVLAYSTFINILEAIGLGLFVFLASFLIPKDLQKNKKTLLQLCIIFGLSLAAVAAQFLPNIAEALVQSTFLRYLAINLVNTKLYRRIALALISFFATGILFFGTVRLHRSKHLFRWAAAMVNSLISLAWLYLALDLLLFITVILRVFYVI